MVVADQRQVDLRATRRTDNVVMRFSGNTAAARVPVNGSATVLMSSLLVRSVLWFESVVPCREVTIRGGRRLTAGWPQVAPRRGNDPGQELLATPALS
jgi:hypothetical protein